MTTERRGARRCTRSRADSSLDSPVRQVGRPSRQHAARGAAAPRWGWPAAAIGFLLGSAPAGVIRAQAGTGTAAVPPSATNATAWLSYDGDHPLGGRWKLFLDASARRAEGPGGLGEWQQLEALVGGTVALTPRLTLSAGPGFVRTYAYGDRPLPGPEPERRVWEQLQWVWRAGRLTGSVRGRVEHRWIAHSEPAAGPADASSRTDPRTWRYTARAVPELRATLPLGRSDAGGAGGRRYTTVALEGFGRLTGGRRYVEQMRETVALGCRVSATTRVELGYLHQTLYDAPRRARETNHTALVVVRSAVPLRP